jgi:hypothetical protein
MNKKSATPLVRSSAAEYLTFVAASGQGGVEAVYADENVWLTQKMLGQLYDVNVRTVSEHLKKIFSDSELQEDSVIRKFRITASDGKTYNTQHYNLAAIIAVGYKVNSERAVQFRKWAIGIIESFTIKGYTLRATEDTPFFHHVASLAELQMAAVPGTGKLYTFHFNALRSIMEKTASFFGHSDISFCLKALNEEDLALYNRALNLLSHGKYAIHEPTEMGEDNKELFRHILEDFTTAFQFDLPDILGAPKPAAHPAAAPATSP